MTLHHGDCIEVMAGMEPESVDAIVTDPPYGLEFMGKEWDRLIRTTDRPGVAERFRGRRTIEEYRGGIAAQLWHQQWAEAAYRVAKPSAYLLAFGGTRTVHRMTCALEDAGWIIRDMLVWGYASGFPKSKASLKPAWEPVVMARKPGPLRMLAIDECRIGTDEIAAHGGGLIGDRTYGMGKGIPPIEAGTNPHLGRWPANIVLTDPIFDGGIEGVVGGGVADAGVAVRRNVGHSPGRFGFASGSEDAEMREDMTYGDTGTYSRFFLVPKSARQDREPVIGHQHRWVVRRYDDGVEDWRCADCGAVGDGRPFSSTRVNIHPTVKPVDLMRHLIRLVTPTGGTVLDPFLGSGTTALAAEMEGFPWIGIEREAEYVAIAEARLNGTQRGMGLGA